MNITLNVASLYHCDLILKSDYANPVNWDLPFDPERSNPMWSQTATGCKILNLLQEMYQFNVTYFYQDTESVLTEVGGEATLRYSNNDPIDIYVRPLSCRAELLNHLYPLQPIYTWSFGFLLRRQDITNLYRTFYSKPFTRPAWNCLYGMALLFSVLFYLLKRWEKRVLGGWESSFSYEALMVIGAYCQHIPPLDATLLSRRAAYFIFFVFAYIVYTFYTSNLLSHLVNDKDHDLDLQGLAESDYQCVIVDYMKLAIEGSFAAYNRNYSIMVKKLTKMPSVTVPEGMNAMKVGHAAILSDYTSLYPYIRRSKAFDNDEICKLIRIDLFSNIKKYFFTSKDFRFKELFKIGTLRARETGILSRLLLSHHLDMPQCAESYVVQAGFMQISTPLTVLFCTYLLCVLILVAERAHFKRNRVWPYVE